jgi:hypothetical protein
MATLRPQSGTNPIFVARPSFEQADDLVLRTEPIRSEFKSLLKRRKTYKCCVLSCEKKHGNTITSRQPPTPHCDHDRNACDECLVTLFTTGLRDSNLERVVCPDPECRKPIQSDEVRRLVPALYEKYWTFPISRYQPSDTFGADKTSRFCRLKRLERISSNPGFRRCSNPECDEGQVHHRGGMMDRPVLSTATNPDFRLIPLVDMPTMQAPKLLHLPGRHNRSLPSRQGCRGPPTIPQQPGRGCRPRGRRRGDGARDPANDQDVSEKGVWKAHRARGRVRRYAVQEAQWLRHALLLVVQGHLAQKRD